MPVYYRGPQVLITGEIFAILVPPRQEFRIAELRDVHIVRGDLPPLRMVSAHAAGGAIVLAIASWPILHSTTASLAALALVVSLSLVGGACWRLAPRVHELRATYRGFLVPLYSSADGRTFGQVCRGLLRAIEDTEMQRIYR